MVSEFPGNSHRLKAPKEAEQREKIESVVSTPASIRKKPLSRRFAELFGGGDAKSVWQYVLLEVLVPAAKDMIVDGGSQFIERSIFGNDRPGTRRPGHRPGGSAGYTAYNRYAQQPREESRPAMSRRARAIHDFNEIILASRVEADAVIDGLFDRIAKYESATVADLYEFVDQPAGFTDEKWGWVDIRDAGVKRVRDGYLLMLPAPIPLD